jgi:hypothetical protein
MLIASDSLPMRSIAPAFAHSRIKGGILTRARVSDGGFDGDHETEFLDPRYRICPEARVVDFVTSKP